MRIDYKGYSWESCWGVVGEWAHDCDKHGGCSWVDAWLWREDDDAKSVLLELFIYLPKSEIKGKMMRPNPKPYQLFKDPKDGSMIFGTDKVVNTSNVIKYVEAAIDMVIAGVYIEVEDDT